MPYYIEHYQDLENIFELFYNFKEENHNQMFLIYEGYITPVIISSLIYPDRLEEIISWSKDKFEKLRLMWPHCMEIELYDEFFEKMCEDLRKS